MRKTIRSTAMILATIFGATSPASSQQRPTTLAGRSTVYSPRATIATSQPLATAAGLHVLQMGGNAIDAAVTAAAVLAVVEPHMTGIGGDLFAMIWSASEGKLVGLNASGRSGSLMTRETLVSRGRREVPARSVEAITVPGALSGWAELLETYGTLTLAEALQPAIRLAEEGFPVSPIIASQWQSYAELLARDPGASETFLRDGTTAPKAGEWFNNPDLANAFRQIAQRGPGYLYGGELGRKIADWVQANGGFLTVNDLAEHRPEWVEPLSVPFKGYRLWELPPNGQGVAALEMLRILESYDLKAMGHNSAQYLHTLIEAKKLAYADLDRYVGDPDDLDVPPDRLLTDEFIRARRALIDPKKALDRPDPGVAVTASETIYLTAADANGNMISFINSIYDEFGSGHVVPGTGFALQDRGAGFTLQEGLPNTVGPKKRPFHTIIPAFVTKTTNGSGVLRDSQGEEPWLSFGVMGGSMQPQGHIQVLLDLLVFGMDLQQAADAPRFRHLAGRRVALETPIGDQVRKALTALGHEIVDESGVAFGGAQLIMKLARGWAAASDPRKDGMAAGY
jgi:gamma-glutamyltranspeptidase / glutathione hydrolase